MTTTLDVGTGARAVLAATGVGRVLAVYRIAAYLRLPAGLVALTSGLAPRGPLHVRVAALPRLRPGDPVRTDGATLTAADRAVPLDAPTWTGSHTPPGGRTPVRACVRAPAGVCGPGCPHAVLRALPGLAARIGGRGPGLTPAGDDVLAGMLLGLRAVLGPDVEDELCAVAASVRTTEVAAAFLHWAARGQCIEPAHAWLTAADAPARARAERRLVAVGASSGAALLDGLRTVVDHPAVDQPAVDQPSCTEIQTARAGADPWLDQRCGRSVG